MIFIKNKTMFQYLKYDINPVFRLFKISIIIINPLLMEWVLYSYHIAHNKKQYYLLMRPMNWPWKNS